MWGDPQPPHPARGLFSLSTAGWDEAGKEAGSADGLMLTWQLGLEQSAGQGGVAAGNQPAPVLQPLVSRSPMPRCPLQGKEGCGNWGVAPCCALGGSPNWIQLVSCPSCSLSPAPPPPQPGMGVGKLRPQEVFHGSEEVPAQTGDGELPSHAAPPSLPGPHQKTGYRSHSPCCTRTPSGLCNSCAARMTPHCTPLCTHDPPRPVLTPQVTDRQTAPPLCTQV